MADEKKCPHCGKPVPPTALGDLCPECMLKAGLATQTEGPGAAAEGGTRFVPPPIGEIAGLFPQLEILRLIGQGGMGAVYKARQPTLDRFVALKVLPPTAANDPGFAERFNREARALARLNHPNIVAVHDFGKAGTLHYLLMEFVDGANLREVERLGELTPEQALAIVPQICEALQFAHNEGIVHRDIKPENLLLDKKGRVKITDFGIAKMVGVGAGPQNLTGAKDVVGTPHYMAPEQIEKPLSVDHRADIYSLGVVFYEMLTGELPLGKFAPPSKKVQIDVRLDEVVLHALEKEPDRRYQQASQVKTAVETIVTTPSGGSSAYPKEPVPTAAQIEAARKRLKIPARGLIAAAVFQLLFALGLLIFVVPAVARESGGLVALAVIGFTAVGFLIPTAVVWAGAVNMLNLRRYTFTVVASVVAAVAGPGALLGLPFGVWACVELFRPEVRSAFAANRAPTGPTAASDSGKRDFALSQVKGPAIGLVVTGVLDWVLMVVACLIVGFKSGGSVLIWLPFLAMALSSCIIYAGLKFMQLERRGTVMLGSVLAMLVSPGNLIGLPLGIWALVVLNRREVRTAFEANRQGGDKTIPASGVPLFPASFGLVFRSRTALKVARIGWGLGCLGALGFLGSIPGWAWLKCLFGFTGFFGLIGFAVVIELIHRQRHGIPIGKSLPAAAPKPDSFWRFIVIVFLVIPTLGLLGNIALQNFLKTRNVTSAISQTIQSEVGSQLREAGATYDSLQVTVAEERDSGTPFTVSYKGLRHFKYTHDGQPDPNWPASADGQFIMQYIGGSQWQGALGDRQFTVQVGNVDDINLPFINDPQVIGEWQSVDFVAQPTDFTPDKPKWTGAFFLKGLTFLKNGRMSPNWYTWTKGVVIHHGDKTASRYEIREINGEHYLFFEWKSGDSVILGMKPRYYVLKKTTSDINSASTLQFRLVVPKDSTEPADWLPSASGSNQFHLSREVLLDNTAIAQAGVDFSPDGRHKIEIRFTDAGAQKFEEITADNIRRQLAIVFRGRVLSAPVIQSVIPGGECQVDGPMSASEANEFVDCLNRAATPTVEAWIFSPVHEQILPCKPQPNALSGWLNLESGMVLTNSTLDWESRGGSEWIRNNGLDVVTTESAKHFPALLGFDMVIAPAPTNGWNIVTAADAVHNWAFLQNEPQQKQVFGVLPGQTDTFFFETREGGKGVLQILGFADNQSGVKIRYKLVQATASGAVIDPTTGLPSDRHNTRIDSNTGLPVPAGTMSAAINPTTGLPVSPGETGTIDPVTGLPVTAGGAKSVTNVVIAAEKWLALIDHGNYSESWNEAAAIFQGAVTEAVWENSMNTFRQPLGDLVSRSLKSAQAATEMPGAPDGQYVVMQFDTSFANKKSAIETVTFMLEKNGQWKAAGYFIK
ncbi:MAG: protein kinase domain-containing protein [Limisphaerales bacterium]